MDGFAILKSTPRATSRSDTARHDGAYCPSLVISGEVWRTRLEPRRIALHYLRVRGYGAPAPWPIASHW